MILVKLFAFLFFGIHTFLASTSPQTDFIRLDKSGRYPLISFSNSTSKVHRIGLHLDSDAFLFTITADSSFLLDSSTIVSSGSYIPFSLSGQLYLTQLNFATSNEHSVIGSLALAPPFSQGIDLTASIHLSSSSLSNLAMINNFGTFLSSGLSSSQTLHHTTFENITIHDSTEEGAVTLTDQCTLDDCVFTNCQDTFYGLIVSGMTCKTKSWFSAVNSTFTKCVRNDPLAIPVLRRVLDNGNCDTVKDDSTTRSKTFTCRKEIENTFWGSGSYTFRSCRFTGCSSSGGRSGGALYQTKGSIFKSEKLDCSDCVFTSCHAGNHGGAVFSQLTNKHYLTGCTFDSNYVPSGSFSEGTYVDHDGGAVVFNYTEKTLLVRACKFTSNKAAGRGGGLYIGNLQSGQSGHLIENCQFQGNYVQYWYGSTKNIAAGTAGGFYALPLKGATFGECTFINNEVGWHGAGLIYLYSSVPPANVFNYFMFSGNKAYEGVDVYIRAPTMSRTAVDPWTFTDSLTVPPQSDRYSFNTSANEQTISYNDNWLVVGPEVFVNNQVPTGNMNTTSCRHYSTNTHCQTISTAVTDGRGATGLFQIKTIRISLVNSGTPYTEGTIVQILDSIVHIGPMTPSSIVTLQIAKPLTELFDIRTGIANLTGFTLTFTNQITCPLAKISNSNGQLWLYSMMIRSSSSSHSTSLFQLDEGYLYVSGTTIQDFTFVDCPLISFSTKTTKPPRFYNSHLKNIKRQSNHGSVLSLAFDRNSKNIQVNGLSCEGCSCEEGNGGAVAATFASSSGKTFTLTSCSFVNCDSKSTESQKKGGAVYINISDTTSTVRVISSSFSFAGTAVQGQYVHIDCLDGEYVGAANNWSGTLDIRLEQSKRPYYWLELTNTSLHFEKSLYYFIFAPSDAGKDKMIVDPSKDAKGRDVGLDIRTCGWNASDDGIPCRTLKKAFDQRSTIKTISLLPSQDAASPNKYTAGTDQFVVVSDLTITGSDKTKSTIAIDTWSSVSSIFQIRTGQTIMENVTIALEKDISAQFIEIPYNSAYNGEILLKYVTITSLSSTTFYSTSTYFLLTAKGKIHLQSVTVEDFKLSNNSFVGVSTSSQVVKPSLTITNSNFKNVRTEKGKGSIISLSTSSYCAISISSSTFTNCVGSESSAAIYDYLALTGSTTSDFYTGTTFAFSGAQFVAPAKVYFEEPGRYIFNTTATLTMWQDLIGYDHTKDYNVFKDVSNFFVAKATGSPSDTQPQSTIAEPMRTFSLVHVCFTPKEAKQITLYVAGTVGEEQQYFNMDYNEYVFKGCGWEDIPCMTIKQAAEFLLDDDHTWINLTAGVHQPETSQVSIAKSVTIAGQGTVTKAVSQLESSPIFSIQSTVKFIALTFDINADLTLISVNPTTDNGATLTLESVSFQVSSTVTSLASHLIIISSASANPLTISLTTFTSAATTKGAYIYYEGSQGSIVKGSDQLTTQFSAPLCLSADKDLYYLNETDVSKLGHAAQQASLLHFIYAPTDHDTGATAIHLSSAGADIDTCGWEDLTCLTLAKALTQRGTTLSTVILRTNYDISDAVDYNTGDNKQLIIQGESSLSTKPQFSLALTPPDTGVFKVRAGYSLTFSAVAFELAPKSTTNSVGCLFYSEGALAFDGVSLTSTTSDAALAYKVIRLGTGSTLTITGGSIMGSDSSSSPLKLQYSLITILGDVNSVSLTSSSFANIVAAETSAAENSESKTSEPALLNCPKTATGLYYKVKLLMENDTFTNLVSAERSEGGAIYIAQGPDSSVQLLSSALNECKCKADGRGDFIYIDCDETLFTGDNKLLNLLVSSVACKHRTDANPNERPGLQLFINCGNDALTTRVDSSMFLVQLTGEITSTAYSFWGKSATLSPQEVDLLKTFKFYTAKEIYVDNSKADGLCPTTGGWNGVAYSSCCGSKDFPCQYLDVGAKHVITVSTAGTDPSYLYLKQSEGDQLPTETNLRDLTLRPMSDTGKSALQAKEGASISTSGTVNIERISFTSLDTIKKDLILAKDSTTLTITKCDFNGETISKSVVSLTNSRLILQNEEVSSLTLQAPFVTATGLSGVEDPSPEKKVYTVHLENNKFTDLNLKNEDPQKAVPPFLSTESGATLYCKDTQFLFTTVTTVGTLFILAGNTLIEGLTVGHTTVEHTGDQVKHTLISDLITLSGSATLVMQSVGASLTKISDLTTHDSSDPDQVTDHYLISSSSTGPITLDGCYFSSIKHDSSQTALFCSKTADELKGCIFSEISQTNQESDKPLLMPTNPLTSITNCNFYFTADSAKNIITLVGGSTLTQCTFQPSNADTTLPVPDTLIKIESSKDNSNPVTFVQCKFTNIGKVDKNIVSCQIVESCVIKIVFNETQFTYSQGSALGTFVDSDGDVELVNGCSITAYTPSEHRANDATKTTEALFKVGSLTLSDTTISGLYLGYSIIDLTGPLVKTLTVTSCNFKGLTVSGENPAFLTYTNPAPILLTFTGTADKPTTFSTNAYLFEAPTGTTFTYCTFTASSASQISSRLLQTAEGSTVTLTNCKCSNLYSASGKAFIFGSADSTIIVNKIQFDSGNQVTDTFITTTGSVQIFDSTFEGTGKLLSNLISATSVQVEGTTFKNFDHSDTAGSLFTTTFTIAGCTFASIAQSSSGALLEPTSGAITVTDTAFTFTSNNMKNLMNINQGSDIRNCSFAAATDSIDISDTLITIAAGTIPVTFELCNFTKISSTPASGVIKSACGVIFDRVIFSYKGASEQPASLNAFAIMSSTDGVQFEFKDCFFGPYTKAPKDAEVEPGQPEESKHQGNDVTVTEPSATLNSAFITLKQKATLTLTNTEITDLVITGEESCLITTPDEGADPAASITIGSCSFKNVVQSDKTDQIPEIPIFNTPAVTSFTIYNCEFDALTQSKKSYLLSAPSAKSFTITNTNFYLPETVQESILDVTQTVTFSGCSFLKSSTVTADVTTVYAPLIHVNGRTDLSLVNCTFTKINAVSTTDAQGNPVGVPAVVDLGDSITLTARDCSFTTVSSDIKIGQVFNAKSSATFENCIFNETYVQDTNTEVCHWNASIVQLSGGDFTLTNTEFHNISEGALGISGGAHVRIDKWDFANNHPKEGKAYVVAMQRNINCTEASSLTIKDSNIRSTTSLYLITDTCDITYDVAEGNKPNSAFFVPTLSSAEGECPDFSTLSLKFTGTDLLPCNLNFEIFLDGEDTPSFTGPMSDNKDPASLARSNTDDTGPTEVTFETDVDLSNTPEIYSRIATGVRLSYGDGQKTEMTKFDPSIRFPSQREAQGGTVEPEEEDKMAWWYYLIIGGGALLLLLIILLVICCCCCQDEEKEDDEDEEDEEEIKALNTEALLSLNTKDLLPSTAFKDFDTNKVVTVEGMHTAAPYDKTVISAKRSIYYQIHNPAYRQDHNPFNWTATIAYHVCNGVQHILDTLYADQPTGANEVTTDVMKNILNTLCPHCIFAGERDSIVLGSVPNSYQVPVSANAKEGKTDFVFECQRYRSPELTAHPNDDTRAMKESNAVFAIGLIMYEVFTGWLVFDGYPHSRVVEMVSQGARPDLVLVRSVDPNFASILESATAMEAEQRPTIAQLLDKIDIYLPNELRKGGTQHRITASMIDDDDL